MERVRKTDKFLIGFFLILFLIDTYTSFKTQWVFNFTHIVKGALILGGITLTFKSWCQLTRINVVFFFMCLLMLVSFIIELITAKLADEHIYLSFVTLVKYIFPFVLYIVVKRLQLNKEYVVKFLSFTFLTISSVSILVFIFHIELFEVYGRERFGYKALIASQNEASFFYMIGTVFFYRQYLIKQSFFRLMFLYIVILASLVLGTKAAILGQVIFALYVFFTKPKFRFFIFLNAIFLVFVVFGVWMTGGFDYYLTLAEQKGIFYMLTSMRNTFITERLPYIIEDWKWYNFLFGEFKYMENLLEMDLIDLFLFFGLLGSIVYLLLLRLTIFNLTGEKNLVLLLMIQFFIIGGLAGHVFASGINAMYLALTCYLLQVEKLHSNEILSDKKSLSVT